MARFGEIGKQYFDDAGDPLISGKLSFFVSGTTTAKTTYSDSNLSIPNTNPVILTASGRQPDIFFNGSARVVLTTADDVQIQVTDPDGDDITGNFDTWNSITVYDQAGIVVAADGNFYKSFASSNQNNEPSVSPTKWQEIEFIKIWNTSVSYSINDIVKASDGALYKSLVNTNVGNDPVTSPSQWSILTANNVVGDHHIYLTTGNGYGSTNNKCRRYSVVQSSAGTDITRTDTAADGTKITINAPGIYVLERNDIGALTIGFSKNSTELTTNIKTITNTNRLGITTGAVGPNVHLSVTVALAETDFIYMHDSASSATDNGIDNWVKITKIADL